jgi:hypothetical protein
MVVDPLLPAHTCLLQKAILVKEKELEKTRAAISGQVNTIEYPSFESPFRQFSSRNPQKVPGCRLKDRRHDEPKKDTCIFDTILRERIPEPLQRLSRNLEQDRSCSTSSTNRQECEDTIEDPGAAAETHWTP